MSKTILKISIVLFLILIIAFVSLRENHASGTAFLIREFDFPIEWRNSDVKYAQISEEELDRYPALRKTINGAGCSKLQDWLRCYVPPDEWNRVKDFINTKQDTETCIRFGEKCYIMDFVTCCTRDVEISSLIVSSHREPQQYNQNHDETTWMIVATIQNNQSTGTDMLVTKIKIKNLSNITISETGGDMMYYIKNNSAVNNFVTLSAPCPGEYEVIVQVFEKEKILAQRSDFVKADSC